MNKNQVRRFATGLGAAMLLVASLAMPASAAVPNGDSGGRSYGFGGNGYAGFTTHFDFNDSSTLAKLYLEIDITGGQSVLGFSSIQRNGNAVSGNTCSSVTGDLVLCVFKTVRQGEFFDVALGVVPDAGATAVTATGGFSSTGYVTGGNNSHGDAWPLCDPTDSTNIGCFKAQADGEYGYLKDTIYLKSTSSSDGNISEGFGNLTLFTDPGFGGNGQAATLKGLPNGKYAYVNDNGALNNGFHDIELQVNDGADYSFVLLIVYPKGTSAPKEFQHYNGTTLVGTYTACAKGDTTECFSWSNKNSTVTLYLPHNGTLRRSG